MTRKTQGKAPGKAFRTGITLAELFRMFPDDSTAEAWMESVIWGEAGKPKHCPMCGGADKIKPVKTRKPLPYHCGECRRYFSIRTNTVMHRSHISFQNWAIALYLWAISLKGVSSMKLHRDLGIRQSSAYHMSQRLRECFADPSSNPFAGPAEVDETYIGGKEKNKHASKKLRSGRGAVGKVAVIGTRDRATGRVTARPVADTTMDTLQGFVHSTTLKQAMVYTDDHAGYKGIDRPHEAVKHSVSEYVNGMAHTNGIESFWAALKRGYHGTFHHMSEKHLHRYVNEFAGRHNLRNRDTIGMMEFMARGMVGKRLTYREMVK